MIRATLIGLVAVATLSAAPALKPKPKPSIVGSWELTRSTYKDWDNRGLTLEFEAGGKLNFAFRFEGQEPAKPSPGTYSIDGDQLTTTLSTAKGAPKDVDTIAELTENKLLLRHKEKGELEFKRKKK